MDGKLFKKNLAFGTASFLIFIGIIPAFNSCVLNTIPQSFDTEYSNNDDYINMRKEIVVPNNFFTIQEAINNANDCDIIVPVDYDTIQEAIYNSNDGDTICVWEGIYEEDIIIEKKNITLIGNGSDYTVIQGEGQNENVVTITNANNIEITGFKITNGKSVGMYLNNTHGCIINNNYFGDTLSDSLFVFYSQDAIIINNEFEGCGLGIYGNKLEDFLHTIEGNYINGLDLFYGKNIIGLYISGIQYDYGSVILVNCTNVVIDGLDDLKNTHIGIELAYCSTEVTVKNCIDVSNNYYGIYVYNCFNSVEIYDNEIYENEIYGIHLRKSSIKLYNNNVNHNDEYGIGLWDSSGNHIKKNDIFLNNKAGIYLYFSHNNEIGKENWIHKNTNGIEIYNSYSNSIHNNTVEKNSYNGIFLKNASCNDLLWNVIEHNTMEGEENDVKSGIELKDNSCENKIEYNNISLQEFWGILIHDNSNRNMIYHNIFYFNGHFWQFEDRHAFDECENIWDDGYPEDYEDFE